MTGVNKSQWKKQKKETDFNMFQHEMEERGLCHREKKSFSAPLKNDLKKKQTKESPVVKRRAFTQLSAKTQRPDDPDSKQTVRISHRYWLLILGGIVLRL